MHQLRSRASTWDYPAAKVKAGRTCTTLHTIGRCEHVLVEVKHALPELTLVFESTAVSCTVDIWLVVRVPVLSEHITACSKSPPCQNRLLHPVIQGIKLRKSLLLLLLLLFTATCPPTVLALCSLAQGIDLPPSAQN